MATRMAWMDVCKGLGIALVVIGHNSEGPVKQAIFLFHMPLFFFLSGMLTRPEIEITSFATKRARQLLIPYVAFLSTLLIIRQMMLIETHQWSASLAAHDFMQAVLGGRHLNGWAGVFWYVTCFYAASLLVNVMASRLSDRVLLLCASLLACVAYLNEAYLPTASIPENLNVVAMAAPIMILGYLYRREMFSRYTKLLLFTAPVALAMAAAFPALSMDMKVADYGIAVLSLAASISAILGLIWFSGKIALARWLAAPVAYLGRASLVVMFLHQPIKFALIGAGIWLKPATTVLTCLALPLMGYAFLNLFAFTRATYLGDLRSQEALRKHRSERRLTELSKEVSIP
jgi:fucose 4-O-acetylase-like acetyltransferase